MVQVLSRSLGVVASNLMVDSNEIEGDLATLSLISAQHVFSSSALDDGANFPPKVLGILH